MIQHTDKYVRAIDNFTAEMFCEVEALPAPEWKWLKGETNAVEVTNGEDFVITSTTNEKSNRHKTILSVIFFFVSLDGCHR